MGNAQSGSSNAPSGGADYNASACPVVRVQLASSAPFNNSARDSTGSEASTSACPVVGAGSGKYRNAAIYNVYGQRINDPNTPAQQSPLSLLQGAEVLDPKNHMPLEANQLPFPGQRRPLPVERSPSSIPKGGTDGTWVYPSPQMVFNALKRKGKGDDVTEEDMEGFVYAHNNMNEATWRRVLIWERLHTNECNTPTLLKFEGKPDKLSPRAWVRSVLGGPMPFDRHDWVVDRCGREVRYVIDFYFYDEKAGTPEAFEVVARPALDSPGAFLDRVKMGIYVNFARWGLPCPITGHSSNGSSEPTSRYLS